MDSNLYFKGIALLIGYYFCFGYWYKKFGKIDSFFICFLVWGLSNLLMLTLEPVIYAITGNIILDRVIWYVTFGAIDTLSVFLIVRMHKAKNIEHSRESLTICIIFSCLLLLQAFRFSERMYFNTGYLEWLYVEGVKAINIFVLIFFCISVKYRYKVRESNYGL
ncbi:hypothetical protein [Shewanella surugensis]|uniref:Uncharacterized protein n=1 Tax=Shewanella surugensis TaxID=212020 RepID=A0ABT0L934_9GAMM|nr:hypothetical protein [Shewanella surugensis]MCL1124208.1 hypothetical protein [Shewanella surugensis]